jgi:hypothetical protein
MNLFQFILNPFELVFFSVSSKKCISCRSVVFDPMTWEGPSRGTALEVQLNVDTFRSSSVSMSMVSNRLFKSCKNLKCYLDPVCNMTQCFIFMSEAGLTNLLDNKYRRGRDFWISSSSVMIGVCMLRHLTRTSWNTTDFAAGFLDLHLLEAHSTQYQYISCGPLSLITLDRIHINFQTSRTRPREVPIS